MTSSEPPSSPSVNRRHPLLFNRTVGLRDEWANIQKRQ
jgi:hypothetical protein